MNSATPTNAHRLPDTAPQCWRDVERVLEHDTKRLVLYGPPGTGKTYAGLTIGTNGREAFRLVCTEDMTDAQVTGTYSPDPRGLSWIDGLAIRAWKTGARLVIDEIDKASSDVLSTLLAMTDTTGSSRWQNPLTGEIVTPHPDFSVVMTTNLERMIDLPDALRDRFPVQIRISEPHPNAIAELPEHWREIARASADLDDINSRASVRAFLEVARLEVAIGRADAIRLVFGGNPYNAQRIEQAVELATLAIANPSDEAMTLANMATTIEAKNVEVTI